MLGRVRNISHEGNLLVKANFAPVENAIIVDGRRHKIGKVIKVFGPTRAPYITIKPESGLRALAMIGQELYIPPEGKYAKNERRDGADRKMPGVQ